MFKKSFILLFTILTGLQGFSQSCFTISNRTNGNGNSNTCGTPDCSANAKTGHIDVNYGAVCPSPIPSLQLTAVTVGALPNPFCFDPGACISGGTVRYCFRGTNLPASGFMTIRVSIGAVNYSCVYDVNGGAGTLPVTLSFFDSKLQSGQVLVKWRTEQEFNNKHFIISRSSNGSDYADIATINGQGNSSTPTDYTFTDPAPLKGISYYRLRQVDFDGKSTYSNVRRVDNRIDGIQIGQIYPNPASDKITMEVTANRSTDLSANLFSQDGKLVMRVHKSISSGTQNWQIALPALGKGIYELVVREKSGAVITEKISVQ